MTDGQTVPDALVGCWRRNWIQRGDGAPDSSETVIWIQTASGMADLRLDPTRPIEANDSSCGITVVDTATDPMTARWLDGPTGFAQQPQTRYPEPGLLSWQSATVMHERAPSGAYVEEWELLDGSAGVAKHLVAIDAPTTTNLYIVGDHAMLAMRRAPGDLLDEYSFARRTASGPDASFIVELSTSEGRVGQPLIPIHLQWAAFTEQDR